MNLEAVCPIYHQRDPVALHPAVNWKWIGCRLPRIPEHLIEHVAHRHVVVCVVDIYADVVCPDEQILGNHPATLDVEKVVRIRGRWTDNLGPRGGGHDGV